MSAMNISQSFEAYDINPIGDVSLDNGTSKTSEALNEAPVPLPLPKNLEEFSRRNNRALGSINDFLSCLDALRVPGPLMLCETLTFKIAEGAQFMVYRNEQFFPPTSDSDMYTMPVAVKKAKFTLDASQRLDLSTKAARKQVHDMQLEIIALQHPSVRNHRNIVDLLGYAVDNTWHKTPLLVLELAVADLEVFAGRSLEWSVKHQLCLDVGAGLDALHTCGIIHGDLKLKNVLVFENDNGRYGVPFIAKLADFGYSVDEVEHKRNGLIEITLWSPGWEAPEISQHLQEGSPILADEFRKADNYSFGLLVWSLMCLNGSKPPPFLNSSAAAIAIGSIQSTDGMPAPLRSLLISALPLLLLPNNAERPLLVAGLLKHHSNVYQNWELDCKAHERLQSISESETGTEAAHEFEHHWAIPSISSFLVEPLGEAFQHHRDRLSAGHMFAMFIVRSFQDIGKIDVSLQISMLVESARNGYTPAQAVVKRVLDSYCIPHATWVEPDILKAWLVNGASTGSLVAAEDLEAMDASSYARAMKAFRDDGGYVQFYSPMGISKDEWRIQVSHSRVRGKAEKLAQLDSHGNQSIHYLATFGDAEDLADFLNETEVDIDGINSFGETALYKASMRGCWRTVVELCRHGADASVAGIPHGATCLHWLFNFPRDHIQEVASALVGCGGDPNATLDASVVNYHFPFLWSMGSPLHWAIAASSRDAVLALSKLGASMSLRNGCDPYVADELVRLLDFHGTNEGGDSSTISGSAGFSAVDLAASMKNWRILECLRLASNGSLDPTAIDEEGFSPFHRLHFHRVGWTATGLRFSYTAFTGGPMASKESTLQTIRSLMELGFDINKMTRPSQRQPSGEPGINGLTPLMLAVANCDLETVKGLLECGADPNLTNDDGYSALMLFTQARHLADPFGYRQGIALSLLSHSSNVNLAANDGTTALVNRAHAGDVVVVKILLNAGAKLSDNFNGLNVLAMLMRACGYTRALSYGGSETLESCQSREIELLAILQKWVLSGANADQIELIEHADLHNGSLLHYAVEARLVSCVTALLQAGAKVNAIRKKHGVTGRYICDETPLNVAEKEVLNIMEHANSSPMSKQVIKSILSHAKQIEAVIREYGGITVEEKPKF